MHGQAATHSEETTTTPLPPNELQGPTVEQAQRDAINSVVGSMTDKVCARISVLRKSLDDVEQMVLEGSANTKHALMDIVALCARIDSEITHTEEAIAEMRDLATAARP